MHAGLLDGHFTRGERFEFAVFRPEGNPDFAGDGMATGRVFDAAPRRAKRVATRVTFEMDALQPWVHGELTFPGTLRPTLLKCLPRQ